jgi:GTP-binding protein
VGRRARQNQVPPEEESRLPIVALVGRPNVGKSSLFNRLVGGRPALVEDKPGVTRDRRYGVCSWVNARFRVVDTGGLDPSAEGILGAMRGQSLRAVDEAAAVIFVIDAFEGITAVDEDVAKLLRRTGKPVFVAPNKVDSHLRDGAAADAYRLGFDRVFPISASHGRGVGELLDAVVAELGAAAVAPAEPEPERDEDGQESKPGPIEASHAIRMAFVGKPNVGKSSLVNRLLGEERVLVHHEPGTTRDPIDTPFRLGEQDFVLVDTAGLRRRRAVDTLTEAVAAKMSRDQLARADVAVLVIDVQKGATADDARLASLIEESGRAALIVLNKSDLIPRAKLDAQVEAARKQLAFVGYAPVVLTSARTGRGVLDIPGEARRAFTEWSRRVPTSELNRHFEEMTTRRPPPSGPSGRHIRLYYITQADVCPPTFYVSANLATAVGEPYRRYLTNQLRKIYGFDGAPIRVVVRARRTKGPTPASSRS